MSDADKAYKAAVRLIAKAKRDGVDRQSFDTEAFRALEVLPPEIASLDKLRRLDLDNTQISDLAPLAGMAGMTRLSLNSTRITDLAPLAGMVGMTQLSLDSTGVTDLAPLAGMVGMTVLFFNSTGVTDLTPLAGMKRLAGLGFSNTMVSDLTPLALIAEMSWLWLNGSAVLDLRPILGMRKLVSNPFLEGLVFEYCAAAKSNARIAAIAGMVNASARAAALFEYLKDWVPPGEVADTAAISIDLPLRRPAPLEVLVSDTLISIAEKDGLPRQDANARAALGWEALRDYRQDFAAAFNISNYAPLPSYLAAFDRAMGEGYDPARVVRIGVQAQRFVALSLDTSFTGNLPSGAVGDLKMFAAEILVYLNRFPDWVAYREDAEVVDAASVREMLAEFKAIRDVLNDTPEATEEVKQEYAAEVAEGMDEKAGEAEAKALVASTREFQRAISEHEAKRHKNNRALAGKGGEFIDEMVIGPMGVPHHVALRLEKPMRALAKKFPTVLGWIVVWYDATFGKDDGAQ